MSFTKMGNATPKVAIYKSESYKLHQAFVVATGETILPGFPVGLNADGKIFHWKGTGTYLGIATTLVDTYGEVTVMVQGYAIVTGLSGAALDAGYVKPGEPYTGKTDYVSYTQSTQVVGEATVALKSDFIALDAATAAGQAIQILVR